MSYKCYLGGVAMPVTPSKLDIKIKGKNKTLVLLNEGEINFLCTPGLTEITVPLSFPMLSGSRTPDYYFGILEKLKTEKKTTQFIMTRTAPNGRLLFDTNIKVSVEDYTLSENASNGLDVSADVTLKQFRDYSTKVVTVKTTAPTHKYNTSTSTSKASTKTATVTQKRETSSAPKVTTYTVKRGDCLWNIAKKYYGNGAQYTKIYNANRDKIKTPNLIYAGQVLVIP